MFKLPEQYKKYEDKIYYAVLHWSSTDIGIRRLEGVI